MATLLLSESKIESNKEYSDILNAIDAKNQDSRIGLYTQSVCEQYKQVSEIINSVNTGKKDVRCKSLTEMMKESFFHGAGWLGTNFIA